MVKPHFVHILYYKGIKTAEQIIEEILEHITQAGGVLSDWYVGITSDPHHQLFKKHNVNVDLDVWIHRECSDVETAKQIEAHLLEEFDCDGGLSRRDSESRYVYAYKKTGHTIE